MLFFLWPLIALLHYTVLCAVTVQQHVYVPSTCQCLGTLKAKSTFQNLIVQCVFQYLFATFEMVLSSRGNGIQCIQTGLIHVEEDTHGIK